MPTPFELTSNAFNVLGVSLRTKKDEIASAHDDALADHRWPEATLGRAQQALLIPKPRLESEISWLPTISPSSAKDLVAKLATGDLAACHQALQNMTGLDRANLAADLCCRNPRGAGYVSASFPGGCCAALPCSRQKTRRNHTRSKSGRGTMSIDDCKHKFSDLSLNVLPGYFAELNREMEKPGRLHSSRRTVSALPEFWSGLVFSRISLVVT